EDVRHGCFGIQASRVTSPGQDNNSVTDRNDFFKLGGDEDDREALVCECPHIVEDFLLRAYVDAASRLVRQQDTRAPMPPACQQKLLLIAARKRAGGGEETPSVKVISTYRNCRPLTQCLLGYESRSCGSAEIREHDIFLRS